MNCWVRTTTPNCWRTTTTDPVASGKRKRPPCAAVSVSVSGHRDVGGVSPLRRLVDAVGERGHAAGHRSREGAARRSSAGVHARRPDHPAKRRAEVAIAIGGKPAMALAGAKCLRKTFPAMRAGTSAADQNQVAPTFFFHMPGTAPPPAARARCATPHNRAGNE